MNRASRSVVAGIADTGVVAGIADAGSRASNGGPAFPHFVRVTLPDDTTDWKPAPGMSLRDHFAGQVLPEVYRASIDLGNDDQSAIASECYELAEAMLKAREVVL